MKIGPNEDMIKGVCSGSAPKAEAGVDGKFGEILDETMAKPHAIDKGAREVATMSGLVGVSFAPNLSSAQPSLVDRVDSFLNVLGSYQQKLGDGQYALKDIYPLVEQMDREKGDLMPALDSLSDRDELKGIMDQVLIAASVEVVRFNRGDYVDP